MDVRQGNRWVLEVISREIRKVGFGGGFWSFFGGLVFFGYGVVVVEVILTYYFSRTKISLALYFNYLMSVLKEEVPSSRKLLRL